MTPQDFISQIGPAAHAVMLADQRILASISIAQAALESGWGQSGLFSKYCNVFGIKASGSWSGATVSLPTQEDNGGAHQEMAIWRVYPNWQASLQDHAQFLIENERYAPALAAKGAQAYAKALQACGYSTNPNYAHLLMEIVNAHDLTSYDAVVASA